jgi:hypothetical protein
MTPEEFGPSLPSAYQIRRILQSRRRQICFASPPTMTNTSTESTPPTAAEAMIVVCSLQQDLHRTDTRLQQVEVAGIAFGEAQQILDEKVDVVYKLLTQWNGSEMGSGQKAPPQFNPSIYPPPQQDPPATLTAEELTFLKKQEKGR